MKKLKRKMKRRVPRNLPEAVLQCHLDNAICFYKNRNNGCLLIAEFIGRDICYTVEIDNTQDTVGS